MIRFCLISIIFIVHPIASSCQENKNIINGDIIQSVVWNDSTNRYGSASETGHKRPPAVVSNIIRNHWSFLFPMGAASFADTVISYDPGAPGENTGDEPDLKYQNAVSSLGIPDYDAIQDTGSVSLGRSGCIVLKFLDNLLIDGIGPDLAVFLSDSNSETVHVLISQNGNIYRSIGNISKENPFVDISPYGETNARYAYVKLRDNSNDEKNMPKFGADIDAVGAINTALCFSVPADSLVPNENNRLGPSVKKYLSPVVDRIRQFPGATVLIEAHTDNRGSENYNLFLSQQWGGLVRDYFLDQEHLTNAQYLPVGFGESRPRFQNSFEEGRRKNRRIEILIIR